ncbi:MAG: membrane protein insertion efficiency factor YidD [Spirochaetota bacterium]
MTMRILFLVLILTGATAPAAAETAGEVLARGAPGPGRPVPGDSGRVHPDVPGVGGSRVAAAPDRLAALYQERLSALDGARCMFDPTCSAFFREALRAHGPLWATFMLIDRMLYRENRASLHRYPESGVGGRRADPVHRNYIFTPEDYVR